MKEFIKKGVIIGIMPLFVFNVLAAQLVVESPLSDRITGYKIDVALNESGALLTGDIDAYWVNISPAPVSEIQMHMYMNAFRSNKSTFNGSRGVPPKSSKNSYGWIDLIEANDQWGNSLISNMEYIAPDDGNSFDMTVLQITLPNAVQPGDTFRLSGKFETRLPPLTTRTGYSEDYFFVAQWFPKFGVYEPVKGNSQGVWSWNCHQFHRNSEFYSNHSIYDVTITLKDEFIVGTGGIITNEIELPDGYKKQTWRAEDIVDFAWTAWPDYQIFNDRWKHVDIKLLIPPGRKGQAERQLNAVKYALEYFEENVGEYPWPHLTFVDPPSIGSGAGGMEYTTLFTSASANLVPEWIYLPEMVTVHEFGHAYFMGILASNEFEEPWLDEGVNSFLEQRVMDHYFGNGLVNHRLLKVKDRSVGRLSYVRSTERQVTDNTPFSWDYPQSSYGMMSYSKAAVVLHTLMGIIGEDTMNEVFREYYRRWAFKNPSGKDFIDVVNLVVTKHHGDKFGENLDWFFNQTLYGTGICDYRVLRFSQQHDYAYSGVQRLGDSTFVARGDSTLEVLSHRSTVSLQRLGEVMLPVEVRIGLDNGEEITMNWDGKDRYKDLIIDYEEDVNIIWVKLDPDNKNPMDVNIANNSLTTKPDKKPVRLFTLSLRNIIQLFFSFII